MPDATGRGDLKLRSQIIKRSSRLDVKLALEIATQVASGLAAIDETKLLI